MQTLSSKYCKAAVNAWTHQQLPYTDRRISTGALDAVVGALSTSIDAVEAGITGAIDAAAAYVYR